MAPTGLRRLCAPSARQARPRDHAKHRRSRCINDEEPEKRRVLRQQSRGGRTERPREIDREALHRIRHHPMLRRHDVLHQRRARRMARLIDRARDEGQQRQRTPVHRLRHRQHAHRARERGNAHRHIPPEAVRQPATEPRRAKTAQRIRRDGITRLRRGVSIPSDEQREERHDENAEPVHKRGSYENPEGPRQEAQLRGQRHGWEKEKRFMGRVKRSQYAKRAGSREPARRRL